MPLLLDHYGDRMIFSATKDMPIWDKIIINFCHQEWSQQQPVELEFNRGDAFSFTERSATIVVGLNGSGKTTLLKTIQHFFTLIGGLKYPTNSQIEGFKQKCVERKVSLFQVEIQFDIHRLEMDDSSKSVLRMPDLSDLINYRLILEEEASLQLVNRILLSGDEVDINNNGQFIDYMGIKKPLTLEQHLEFLDDDEDPIYREGILGILELYAEERSVVTCNAKYSFEISSKKNNSTIDIYFDNSIYHETRSYLDLTQSHNFCWASDEHPFGPQDFEKVFMKALSEFEKKYDTDVEIYSGAVVSLPLFETVYLSSENFQKPILHESAFSILGGDDLDSIELEIYLNDLNANQLLQLIGVERNQFPLRTYEEFPVDDAAGTIQHFDVEYGKLFHDNFEREQVQLKNTNSIYAPTEIEELGRDFNPHLRRKNNGWDSQVNYYEANSVWCYSFASRLPRTKTFTSSDLFTAINGDGRLLRSHRNTICSLSDKIVYGKNKESLAEFIKYELFKYVDEKSKCEILSRIFKRDSNELLALYTLKSFGPRVESYLTSGQQRLYSIFSEITKEGISIYLIDEPEVSLHIDWQRKIVDQILNIVGTNFVLIATHSPDVIYHHHEKVKDLGSGIWE